MSKGDRRVMAVIKDNKPKLHETLTNTNTEELDSFLKQLQAFEVEVKEDFSTLSNNLAEKSPVLIPRSDEEHIIPKLIDLPGIKSASSAKPEGKVLHSSPIQPYSKTHVSAKTPPKKE